MCNKCGKTHLSWFKTHKSYQFNNEEDFFASYCKEKNHY